MSELKNRREFLEFLGRGSAAAALLPTLSAIQGCASSTRPALKTKPEGLAFQPLSATNRDDLVLAKGFNSRLLLSYNERLNREGQIFGTSNDYLALLPLNESG